MGFLKVFGRALRYEESKQYHKIIKDNAVEAIIYSIRKEKKCSPQFGYEVNITSINSLIISLNFIKSTLMKTRN